MSKKLVGGDYLLDLSSIKIEQSEDGETYTNITDADVLEQLTNLKKYVPNPQMAKPVWIKLKNGENDELVVARGTFANVGTGEFEICVQLNGYKLIISIEFTQALNEDVQPIDDWYIDTNDAKYLFTSDTQNIGAIIGTGEIENAKPLYWHNIRFEKHKENDYSFILQGIIINNNSTPLTRREMFELLKVDGFVMLAVSGVCGATIGVSMDKHLAQLRRYDNSTFYLDYYDTNGEIASVSTTIENTEFIDLGVNKLN